MSFKVGDKVMLKPECKLRFQVMNNAWDFDGEAFGEIIAIHKCGNAPIQYSVYFDKYSKNKNKQWGLNYNLNYKLTHTLSEDYLLDPDIINTPLFELMQETED